MGPAGASEEVERDYVRIAFRGRLGSGARGHSGATSHHAVAPTVFGAIHDRHLSRPPRGDRPPGANATPGQSPSPLTPHTRRIGDAKLDPGIGAVQCERPIPARPSRFLRSASARPTQGRSEP